LITLVGCGGHVNTQIESIKEASPVPAMNIFYKSGDSVNNVIFVRDKGFGLSLNTAYLFMKVDPDYENIKLANLEKGEWVGFSFKEGEYVFYVECSLGPPDNEISQKIEKNKTYYFRISPSGKGFHFKIERTSLKN